MKLTEITPRPKTVVEILENHPERWCTDAMFIDEDGETSDRENAVCACLGGLINLVCSEPNYLNEGVNMHKVDDLVSRVHKVLESSYPKDYFPNIASFNDAPNRRFEDVLEVAKLADI